MEYQAAKNLLIKLEHDIAHPKTTTQAVINAGYPQLIEALKASLAREESIIRTPVSAGPAVGYESIVAPKPTIPKRK